jgi:hypothetical protein
MPLQFGSTEIRLGRLARQVDGGVMILNLSDFGSNAMLDALSAAMSGGSIEMLSDNQRVLAVLKLASPAAPPAVGGAIELNPITKENAARATDIVSFARILSRDGTEIFSGDVGSLKSNAVIKLSSTAVHAGLKLLQATAVSPASAGLFLSPPAEKATDELKEKALDAACRGSSEEPGYRKLYRERRYCHAS